MIEVAFICLTVIGGLKMVLIHFDQHNLKRNEFEAAVMAKASALVEEKLKIKPDFYKDLETVNANQIKLAAEVDLMKKNFSLKTVMSRPPGSLV